MTFLRFIVEEIDPDSGVAVGLFHCAYKLRDSIDVPEDDRKILREHLAWFEDRLPQPRRFNRTKSKGYYRRKTKGISWFRETAKEHLARMEAVRRIAEALGHSVRLIREERVGYVVYEDEYQVVAEPFKETRSG